LAGNSEARQVRRDRRRRPSASFSSASWIRRGQSPVWAGFTAPSRACPRHSMRGSYAKRRMSSYVAAGALHVGFAGGAETWPPPSRDDKMAIRAVRDKALVFARANGATWGQENAVRKALTSSGFHLTKKDSSATGLTYGLEGSAGCQSQGLLSWSVTAGNGLTATLRPRGPSRPSSCLTGYDHPACGMRAVVVEGYSRSTYFVRPSCAPASGKSPRAHASWRNQQRHRSGRVVRASRRERL
jgi:hypothetical protein